MATNLLIHSMSEFRALILDCLDLADVTTVAEIGTEYGGMSTILAEWLAVRQGHLWCIDPSPAKSFLDWLPNAPGVQHIAKPSLDSFPELPAADAWLVDGDHNWYTVYSELTHILHKFWQSGKHPFIFLHDVGWPCARRDQYYAPERVPLEFRKPHTYNAGSTLELSILIPDRGFRGGTSFAYAKDAGGPRNGVLTAVEDVLREQAASGHPLAWCMIPAVFGLGVMFDPLAPWANAVDSFLRPWHQNPLLASLEKNRLDNYLRVIEMQDTLL